MARICSVYFPSVKRGGKGHNYHRLVRAFAASVMDNDPAADLDIRVICGKQTPNPRDKQSLLDNTLKLHEWARAIREAPDGDEVLLIDCDMLVLHPIGEIWQNDFDIAYTVRPPHAKYPLNGGVLFVRVSDLTRAFMDHWVSINDRMMANKRFHNPWRARCGGINQASFGYMIERGDVPGDPDIWKLPCHKWNCEDTTWSLFDPDVTHIVHIKSKLRKVCLGTIKMMGYARIYRLFKHYERRADELGLDFNRTQAELEPSE